MRDSVYKINLLSGGNVVMIQRLGYESELFVPLIKNKRIAFQNVIENHRCCHEIQTSSSSLKPLKTSLTNSSIKSLNKSKPIAYSTPSKPYNITNLKHQNENFHLGSGAFDSTDYNTFTEPETSSLSKNISLPTPDIARRLVLRRSLNRSDIPIPRFGPEIRIIPLHRNPTTNSPKKVGKAFLPVNSHSVSSQLLNSKEKSKCNKVFSESPNVHRNRLSQSPYFNSSLIRVINTPGSGTKWRKCLTPKRTYLRRTLYNSPHRQKSRELMQVKPFEYSMTKGIKSSMEITVQRRKLILDPKVMITPRSFKRQFKESEDLKRNVFELPKKKSHFKYLHLTAFDLLTSSNRSRCLSENLKQVFRNACVNKCSSTDPKYKKLILSIPQLECDNF